MDGGQGDHQAHEPMGQGAEPVDPGMGPGGAGAGAAEPMHQPMGQGGGIPPQGPFNPQGPGGPPGGPPGQPMNIDGAITMAQAIQLIIASQGANAQQPRTAKLHMKEPDAFDGKPQHARNFLMECELYIQGNPHQFPTETNKILFVLSYCKEGAALNFREYTVNQAKNNNFEFGLFSTFKESFTTAFVTSDDKADALRELRSLKQTGDVDAYIQKFKMLLGRAHIYDFETQKGYFIAGLSKTWTDRLGWQTTLPADDIEDWYKTVQKLDQNHRYIQSVKGGSVGGTFTKALPPGEPMDIDAVRLSSEERKKHREQNLCFNCHKAGHIAANCYSKPGNGGGRRTGNGGNGGGRQQNATKGDKVSQIKALMKDIGPDERRQLMDELKGSTLVRVRALMQELPEEEKEQLAEEVVSDAMPEEPQEGFQ